MIYCFWNYIKKAVAMYYCQHTNNSVSPIIMWHIVGISQKHLKLAIKYRLLFKVAYDILGANISPWAPWELNPWPELTRPADFDRTLFDQRIRSWIGSIQNFCSGKGMEPVLCQLKRAMRNLVQPRFLPGSISSQRPVSNRHPVLILLDVMLRICWINLLRSCWDE